MILSAGQPVQTKFGLQPFQGAFPAENQRHPIRKSLGHIQYEIYDYCNFPMYQISAEWRWWVCELLSQAAVSLVVLVTGLVS